MMTERRANCAENVGKDKEGKMEVGGAALSDKCNTIDNNEKQERVMEGE